MSGRERGDDEKEGRAEDTSTPATAGPGERAITKRSETTSSGSEAAKPIRRVRASDVLGPRGILLIEHEGEVYTLRVTRNNRLILTK